MKAVQCVEMSFLVDSIDVCKFSWAAITKCQRLDNLNNNNLFLLYL